jgi:hypothetical protein
VQIKVKKPKLLTPAQRKKWVAYYLRGGDLTMNLAIKAFTDYPGEDKPSAEMALWRRLTDAARFFWHAGQMETDSKRRAAINVRFHAVLDRLKKGVDAAFEGTKDE